jgi:hypothetical protein
MFSARGVEAVTRTRSPACRPAMRIDGVRSMRTVAGRIAIRGDDPARLDPDRTRRADSRRSPQSWRSIPSACPPYSEGIE